MIQLLQLVMVSVNYVKLFIYDMPRTYSHITHEMAQVNATRGSKYGLPHLTASLPVSMSKNHVYYTNIQVIQYSWRHDNPTVSSWKLYTPAHFLWQAAHVIDQNLNIIWCHEKLFTDWRIANHSVQYMPSLPPYNILYYRFESSCMCKFLSEYYVI